jgi:hypothetical protein
MDAELRFQPLSHDALVILESEKMQPWQDCSFIDCSINTDHSIFWIVPEDTTLGIGAVLNTDNRSSAKSSLKDCSENYFPVVLSSIEGI